MKKLRNWFIGDYIAKTDDVFEKVKAEVLYNFTLFFVLTNIPYFIMSLSLGTTIHVVLGVTTLIGFSSVLFCLKKVNLLSATYLYMINHAIQNGTHYFINNGKIESQGLLFFILFVLFGFFMLGRIWGWSLTAVIIALYIIGTYNENSGFALFKFPPEMADPTPAGAFKYLPLIPILLNIYLVSEFVKAKQKAEKQIQEQRTLLETKNREIIDSIHYAKRIQQAVIRSENYIQKTLERLKRK